MRKLVGVIAITVIIGGCDAIDIIKDNFTHEQHQEIKKEVFREGNQFYYRNELNQVIPISMEELAYYSELASK